MQGAFTLGVLGALLLSGFSAGIADAFPGRPWAGPLIAGAASLGVLIFGVAAASAGWKGASRRKTIYEYEARLARQRAAFGRDVHDQTTSARDE